MEPIAPQRKQFTAQECANHRGKIVEDSHLAWLRDNSGLVMTLRGGNRNFNVHLTKVAQAKLNRCGVGLFHIVQVLFLFYFIPLLKKPY